eukprot:GHVS01004862.1.p1 GENE.GHVS01004862.1~~GHVS01004862.1.p1  ORF type:complete len:133 (+),score=16.37 GHVS01004862.1:30-428(+)
MFCWCDAKKKCFSGESKTRKTTIMREQIPSSSANTTSSKHVDQKGAPATPSASSGKSNPRERRSRDMKSGDDFNAELAAQRIMQKYNENDFSAVQDALRQFDPEILHHALGRAKELGNEAFKRGQLRDAIDC